jgi:hypothetical protein
MIVTKREWEPGVIALVLRRRGSGVIGTSRARKSPARAIQTCISPA